MVCSPTRVAYPAIPRILRPTDTCSTRRRGGKIGGSGIAVVAGLHFPLGMGYSGCQLSPISLGKLCAIATLERDADHAFITVDGPDFRGCWWAKRKRSFLPRRAGYLRQGRTVATSH